MSQVECLGQVDCSCWFKRERDLGRMDYSCSWCNGDAGDQIDGEGELRHEIMRFDRFGFKKK